MRYISRETEHPTAIDYYCEATQTTQDHFPRIPAHTHNYYEIYIFLNGFVKIAIEDQIYNVKYGDIMLIPLTESTSCSQPPIIQNLNTGVFICTLPSHVCPLLTSTASLFSLPSSRRRRTNAIYFISQMKILNRSINRCTSCSVVKKQIIMEKRC